MNDTRTLLVKGGMWLILSRALVNGMTIISTLVLARFLMPADFGLVALSTTILTIVSSLTQLSISQALMQFESPSDIHFQTAWTLNAIRGAVLSLVLAGFALPVSLVFSDPRLFGIMLTIAVTSIIGGLANPKLVVFQRKLVFWQDTVLNVSQKLFGVVVSIGIVVIYKSYWAIIIGLVVGQVVGVLVSYMVMPFRPRLKFGHIKEFFAFSGWLSASQIVNTLNWYIEYLLIGKILGTTSLGLYSVGNNLSVIPTRETTTPLKNALYPSFTAIRTDLSRLVKAYQRSQAIITAIALPAGVGFALIADRVVLLTMGHHWVSAVYIIQILASVFALQTLGSLVQPLAMALGNVKLLFERDFQTLLVRVPILILALIFWGLPGIVVGRVLTGLYSIIVNLNLVKKLIGLSISKQIGQNFRALASVAMMTGTVLCVSQILSVSETSFGPELQILLLVLLGAITYCGFTVLLWAMMKYPAGPEAEVCDIVNVRWARGKVRNSAKK